MKFQSVVVRRTEYEGTKQAEAILLAARRVFARDGAAGFSARGVAKEAGLSLGSVQHVFPTVDALLLAMLEHVITRYDEAYQRMLEALPFDPQKRWDATQTYLLEDIFKDDTRRLFFGFWSMSCSHPLAAQLLQEAYAYHRDNLSRFIASTRPDLRQADCDLLAIQVAAMIEGSMIFTAPRSRLVSRRSLIEGLRRSIWTLIHGAGSGTPAVAPPVAVASLPVRRRRATG